jgi:hypothetical protein
MELKKSGQHRTISAIALSIMLFAISATCQAPAWHLGAFNIEAPAHCGGINWCSAIAFTALQRSGFKPVRNSQFTVSGGNNDTSVVVHCTPTGNHVSAAVFAASNNFDHAAYWRSEIRSKMQETACM